MKTKTNLIASFLFALLISGIIIYQLRQNNAMKAPQNPFYNYTLTQDNGKQFDPNTLKETVFIVSYFQTWCSDCVKEQPELMKLQKQFAGKNFKILMVTDESMDKINAFKQKFGDGLNIFQLKEPIKSIGIKRFPTTYLINKKGEVVVSKVEGINWFTPEIVKTIEDLL